MCAGSPLCVHLRQWQGWSDGTLRLDEAGETDDEVVESGEVDEAEADKRTGGDGDVKSADSDDCAVAVRGRKKLTGERPATAVRVAAASDCSAIRVRGEE